MIAYLDCVGGLAGDMLIAALIDAGAPEEKLREVPRRLGLNDVELKLERVNRQSITALHFRVLGERGNEPRSWVSIREHLLSARLDEMVLARASAVFERLAQAEAKVHGSLPEAVHFHELGNVDTLVDVVGAVTLLQALGIDRLVCSPLPLGRGMVSAAHGVLPLPAPATMALLIGIPVFGVGTDAELVTPTGAALASVLVDEWGPPPAMTLTGVGYGAGTKAHSDRANVVRLLLGDSAGNDLVQRMVVLLETNLDDFNPELIPDAIARCFAAGALDVWTTPAAMKKGRPGVVLAALARPGVEREVARTMLVETTALGVRVSPMHRYELDRGEVTVDVYGCPVRVKVGRLEGRVVNIAPEHDDCSAVAEKARVPVKTVWTAALAAAQKLA